MRPVCVVCGELHDNAHRPASKDDCNSNKKERYSQVQVSDTRYLAKGTKGKWSYASSKARLKCAT